MSEFERNLELAIREELEIDEHADV